MRDSLDLEATGSSNDPAPDVDWQETFEAAVEGFSDRPLVILAEVPDGSTAPLVARLPSGLEPVFRVAGTPASRGMVGCVAEELELDRFEEGVIAIDDAQWVDPTSLGRLQRLIDGRPRRLLMIIAHRPLSGTERWALGQIGAVAEDRATLVEFSVDTGASSPVASPPDDRSRDLALAARLVSGSIPVEVVARFLDVPESEALDVAEGLVGIGLLNETRAGFLASPEALGLAAGEARLGHLAGRLAQTLEHADGDPAVIGSLWQAAGASDRAFPHLQQGALAASRRAAIGEAYLLAEDALAAAEQSEIPEGPELGELHLICGRFLRATGRSEEAAVHLDRAVTLLEGPDRIDALGFAAAVADDRQHPQEAEIILSMAELEAVRVGERAKLASLGTFRARALNRIGFAPEADYLLEKSLEQMAGADASPRQRFNGEVNRAWILFDRGQVARAEVEFTHLRDLTDPDDLAGLADKEAWRARALFGAGRPDEALAAVGAARDLADRAGVDAPLFLADLALSEGNLALGRYEEALAAAERVLDLVERQLPAWENVARAQRSLALLHLGRHQEADDEIEAALAATPPGANGWRWRAGCRSIQLEIAAARERSWPRREAEDLADMLLQSRFYGWAAELMCVIAEKSKDAGFAQEALALALQVGNPMRAARAAAAGKLWRLPVAAPAIRAIKSMEARVPAEWLDAWRSLPAVEQALAAPEPTDAEAGNENQEVLEQALRRAGLSGDEVLSPAQRRRRGLVRRRRVWRPITVAAAALGVVALAGLTSYAIAELNEAPPGVTTVIREVPGSVAPATTAPLALEETRIPLPDGIDFLSVDGAVTYRGNHGRTGYVDVAGPRSFGGHFWTFDTAGQIEATPVAYGRNLLVGGTDNTFYALGLSEGNIAWTLRTDDRVATAADVGSGPIMEGNPTAYVVIADSAGNIRLRDPLQGVAPERWRINVGASILAAPVLYEGMIYAATTDGYVFGVDTGGNVAWRFPEEGEPGLGTIRADLTFVDGVVYATTSDGGLYLIDSAGQEICREQFSSGIDIAPIVSEGVAYIFTLANTIYVRPAGSCTESRIEGRLSQYVVDAPLTVAPAIVGDVMYLPAERYLYKLDLLPRADMYDDWPYIYWPGDTVVASSQISAPPVVTNDTLYFGTAGGTVYAVDTETGEELGVWETGNIIRGQPLVIDHALFIAGGSGTIYAIGE
jgi:outer membrane protein assembly factor BamB/tetratricopeptide (TPR) repeat protein